MKITALFFASILQFVSLSAHAEAAELKLATWNLEWLTDLPDGNRELPPDAHPKSAEAIDLLHRYGVSLNADVIAIEEVDGRAIAARIFPPDHYSIHMTRDRVVQRVGLVVRRGIRYDTNPDITTLQIGDSHLRSGADITLQLPQSPLRILAVHLKTGCFDRGFTRTAGRACGELQQQTAALTEWVTARQAEGVAFAILGDFNRHMDGRDTLWATLHQAVPSLLRATEGHASPCWGGEAFIDHIMLGGTARDWLLSDSLSVLVYTETGAEWKERLSDHCPVSVRLRIPD